MNAKQFSARFQKYNVNFLQFAKKLTKSEADAKDLLQDASIRAYRKRSSFTNLDKFKSWFNTIIYNTFVNRFRRKSRRRNLLNEQLHTSGLFFNRKKTHNLGYEALKKNDLENLMQGISTQNIEAFELYNTGYSYQEISEIQNIPIGTVKSRIYFVRNKMKKVIEEKNLFEAA